MKLVKLLGCTGLLFALIATEAYMLLWLLWTSVFGLITLELGMEAGQ